MSISSKRIRYLIERSNKSYQELEKETGIKKSSLQRYAAGVTSKIPPETIKVLSRYFGVSTNYILGEEDDDFKSDQLVVGNSSRRYAFQKLDSLLISIENEIAHLFCTPSHSDRPGSDMEKLILFLFRLMSEQDQLKMVSAARSILEEHHSNTDGITSIAPRPQVEQGDSKP